MTFWRNDHTDKSLLKNAVKTAERCRIFYGDLIDEYSEIDGFEKASSHASLEYANEYESVNDALNEALWVIRSWNETEELWNENDTWSPELAAELGKLDAACRFIEMIQEDERANG